MRKRLRCAMVVGLGMLLGVAGSGAADVEWQVQTELKVDGIPRDLAVSRNGRWTYVLTEAGDVHVFDHNGTRFQKLHVGPAVDRITAGVQDDTLLLASRQNGTVKKILLDYVRQINTSGSPFKGAPAAPVEIAVFTDFECAYCSRLVPLLDQVLAKNPDTVKVVFKNFPLRSHKFSIKAAVAALAAGKMGKFWEFHDLLFENYDRLNDAQITQFAEGLGLDQEQFQKHMQDKDILQQIRADMMEGSRAGVKGTPTVYVNGRSLRDRSLEGFQALIDKEMKKRPATGPAAEGAAVNN